MRAVVRQAVHDVRTASPAVPASATVGAVVDDLAAGAHRVDELMLEVTPAYLPDAAAANVPLCEASHKNLEHGLAARRYTMSGYSAPLTDVLWH